LWALRAIARLPFIVITTHQRNTALLVAGCLFMDMLDETKIMVP
jgi:hypothetical protein